MERTLDVYLHRDLVGAYTQSETGKINFRYAETWLNKPNAVPLSHSLPLRRERFNRAECGKKGLAPFYDLLCTGYYPQLSQKMAMKLGGESDSRVIFPRHFERFADDAKLSKPLVRQRVPELAEEIVGRLPDMVAKYPEANAVAEFIEKRCQITLERFK